MQAATQLRLVRAVGGRLCSYQFRVTPHRHKFSNDDLPLRHLQTQFAPNFLKSISGHRVTTKLWTPGALKSGHCGFWIVENVPSQTKLDDFQLSYVDGSSVHMAILSMTVSPSETLLSRLQNLRSPQAATRIVKASLVLDSSLCPRMTKSTRPCLKV